MQKEELYHTNSSFMDPHSHCHSISPLMATNILPTAVQPPAYKNVIEAQGNKKKLPLNSWVEIFFFLYSSMHVLGQCSEASPLDCNPIVTSETKKQWSGVFKAQVPLTSKNP